eukprot:TRINITY_DN660_c0_g1_i1.p1 TRINITY_DN660_c0_g1~~TRINITY_DN660_c0_g1_i1.p1  ORF type:complete len:589 (-),score=50.06 TRINITY_DN660_c0_g1_i1:160-1689(-)
MNSIKFDLNCVSPKSEFDCGPNHRSDLENTTNASSAFGPIPVIRCTTEDDTEKTFKKPLHPSTKRHKNIPQSRKSLSESNIFSVEDNKENDRHDGNVPSNAPSNAPGNVPSNVTNNQRTPSKFVVRGKKKSPSPSPSHLSQVLSDIKLTSPTKLTQSARAYSEQTRSTPTRNHVVEETLSHIRAVLSSPRKKTFLPILLNTSQPELNCLSSQTVAELVSGKFSHYYSKVLIVDCRFEYEYHGGHIRGAINLASDEEVDRFFMKETTYHNMGETLCLVFHCEFSSHRGPKAYKKLRSWDRKKHEACYPTLLFPEMYLLEGGYRKFYEDCADFCEPRGYIEMRDQFFINECKEAMKFRNRSKSCSRISRSCTNILDLLESESPLRNPMTMSTCSVPSRSECSMFGDSFVEPDHSQVQMIFGGGWKKRNEPVKLLEHENDVSTEPETYGTELENEDTDREEEGDTVVETESEEEDAFVPHFNSDLLKKSSVLFPKNLATDSDQEPDTKAQLS